MVIKIFGYIITYSAKDNNSRTNFHHTLFGRLMYRNYRSKKYAYYVPGMLNNTYFTRIMNSKVFITKLDDIDFSELEIFSNINIEEVNKDILQKSLKTGKEYWLSIAKEKGLDIHIKAKNRK